MGGGNGRQKIKFFSASPIDEIRSVYHVSRLFKLSYKMTLPAGAFPYERRKSLHTK